MRRADEPETDDPTRSDDLAGRVQGKDRWRRSPPLHQQDHLGHVHEALVAARTPASFAERAHERLADTIVAARTDEVAGFVMIDRDQVDQLYLSRSARGGGIGAALLSAAEQAVIAAGYRQAWLAVATGNTGARGFYARQGWVDDGPFVHHAPVPGGSVAVDCHRFVSPLR